jgi:hypothetical protein
MRPHRLMRCVAMVVLLVLPVLIMFWLWHDVRRVPWGVLCGKFLQSGWDNIHAGFCMDQPTIGKWYIWFTVFGGVWVVFAFAASRLCLPCSRGVRRLYVVLCAAAAVVFLCVLTVPFHWTVLYILAMGFTYRRVIALVYGLLGYGGMLAVSGLLMRRALKGRENRTSA